ncbi:LysR family transcriptional regulator substrate-binding protein [Streptomyces sp. NBC_00996]|uniref:LysR family transcriptional regulator substrate-binding protein n=1 Tax=Streptomyces sp. NBC_00996 TaxID=2903710 RepID=UPI003866D4DF|nr:LysR family transcriptional regulator substrate-binding protein [Streptomyces sp. NBC_00996]
MTQSLTEPPVRPTAEHPRARVALASLSSAEIRQGLAEFELDAAMTYLDDDELRPARGFPLYEERYVLLTPVDGPLATAPTARWAQAAALPLCLLSPRMRNRRIIDACFAADGATAARRSSRTASPGCTRICRAAAGPA